jgi:hypothetical protein
MVSGTMGIIGCPMLEDEIVYSLCRDKDKKNIFVVDTPNSITFKRKLEQRGIPFSTVDEWEFNNGFCSLGREDEFNVVVILNKLGLHSEPKLLKSTLEDQLIFHQNHFDSIALYYGMCGNAGWDATKWASDKFRTPVFTFHDKNGDVCDDCIGVAVGGHSRYCDFVRKYTGMLLVTPAVAGTWKDYSKELDFLKGFEVLDIHSVREVFAFYGYKNAVRIETGLEPSREEFDAGCKGLAEETGLVFIDAEPGSADIFPAEKIYRDTKDAVSGKH